MSNDNAFQFLAAFHDAFAHTVVGAGLLQPMPL